MSESFGSIAHTKSGELSYVVEHCEVQTTDVADFIMREKCNLLCKEGCANYSRKWSCPPFSPSYQDYSANYEKLTILYMRINLSQFSYIKNDYLKIRAANTILKSRIDAFLRQMAMQYRKPISTGSCRLCKPCKRKLESPCAHPTKMAFSFESLGVDVCAMVNKFFTTPLLWYKPHILPEYTSVVGGLLTNRPLSNEEICEKYHFYIER